VEITGKLIKILELESGQSANGGWVKQVAVIETAGDYPKKIAVTFFKQDVIDQLKKKFIGEDITVSINVESREYNDRWYTEVKAWKIN
jgi:hypothetical protein